jgi:nucleotide-binding universal stress UspA family protein
MYKRAVVPLDGSTVAESILPFLLEIAGPLDIELVLLQVLNLLPSTLEHVSPLLEPEARRKEAEEYLQPVAAGLRQKGVRTQVQVRIGDPAAEIRAGATEVGADLIAMTTHGRSGLGRLLFGSVAEAVLRQGDVPVFLMRQTEAALAGARNATALAGSER